MKDVIKLNRNVDNEKNLVYRIFNQTLVEIKLLLVSMNGSLRETSLFFVLPKYVEIILMR